MTPQELRDAVGQGARFVLFQYCVSVIVLSFKRSSPIFFVKPGESVAAKGLPYCLISLFAGWWGIPWGPVWTLTTLANNLGGGKDLTPAVLSALGLPAAPVPPALPELSAAATAEREARKTLILRLAWAVVAVMFLGAAWIGYKVYKAGQP
jgi:hypothetical protein